MLFHPLFVIITATLTGINSLVPPWVFNPATTGGGIMAQSVYFLATMNKFFPILDGIIPVFLLTAGMVGFGLIYRTVLTLVNVVRGSGA